MADKVSNEALLNAGINALAATGRKMVRVPTGSRAMIYRLETGETVRVRTCNDHILVVLASSPDDGAALNIEGSDYLLIAMPEIARTEGRVISYFIPTRIAVEAVRHARAAWVNSGPATKGNNRTWNIWFDDDSGPTSGFASKWSQYRLPTTSTTVEVEAVATKEAKHETKTLGEVIAEARQAIAKAAGVSIDSVKISVSLD